MLEVAALFYGVIASFIMASTARNRREARRNPPIVALFGWFMLAFCLMHTWWPARGSRARRAVTPA